MPTARCLPGSIAAWRSHINSLISKPPIVTSSASVTSKASSRSRSGPLSGGGTPHKPPVLDAEGFVIHESTMLARHLVQRGVDPYRILKESASYDTVGNAYFTLTTHTIPAKWKRMAIVTSNFHMPRAKTLFTDIFSLAADDISSQFIFLTSWRGCVLVMFRILLEFFGASDSSVLSPKTLAARQEREALSLKQWKEKSKELKTLEAFHKWLHETHQCYAVQRQHEFSHSNLNTHDAESY